MWECPDLFPLGDKHVLIHSAEGKAYWQTGVLDQKELIFHPEHAGALDHGSFYAPKTQLDKSGNRILWGWLPETRKLEEYRASGWAGMMSLPRVLTLSREGQLRICVAPVVESLRSTPQVLKVTANDDQNQRQVRGMAIANCSGEVLCVVRRGGAPFGLSLGRAQGMLQNGGDWLALRYDPTQPDKVTIDDKAIPIEFNNDPDLELHLYIDGSVMEVFVNKQAAYTKRFYYPDMKSPEIGISITGKTTDISRLSTWQLSPISHDRLTT
jgi:beta-fructofuranosidase